MYESSRPLVLLASSLGIDMITDMVTDREHWRRTSQSNHNVRNAWEGVPNQFTQLKGMGEGTGNLIEQHKRYGPLGVRKIATYTFDVHSVLESLYPAHWEANQEGVSSRH